jgi:hypothetical protein
MGHQLGKGNYNGDVLSSTVKSSLLCNDQPDRDQLLPLLTLLVPERHACDSYLKYLSQSSHGEVLLQAEQVLQRNARVHVIEAVNATI